MTGSAWRSPDDLVLLNEAHSDFRPAACGVVFQRTIMDNREEKKRAEQSDKPDLKGDRRDDGTKGSLDTDKSGAAHKDRKEETGTSDSSGTGIPGFGV
jgi:hypothetical protein